MSMEEDDIELPVIPPPKPGPDCPFCGEPTMMIDGDYMCFDCNGAEGPTDLKRAKTFLT